MVRQSYTRENKWWKMMRIVYRLETMKYFGYDGVENENIEERYILGHFTDIRQLIDAISQCINNGVDEKEIYISSFMVDITSNQKYIYVLSHEYSIMINEEYVDYYIFEPLSNRKKCIELRENLKKEPKYAFNSSRCYDIQPPDGFYITKLQLNYLYD